MAGISVHHLGKPQITLDEGDSTSVKMQESESEPMAVKIEPAVVSVSPQGKGVGVFGIDGSHEVDGQKNEGPLKDPKVYNNWGWLVC